MGDSDSETFECDFIHKPKCYKIPSHIGLSPSVTNDTHDNELGDRDGSSTPPNNCSTREEIPYEYINPFTPDGKVIASKLTAQKIFKRLSLSDVPPAFNLNDSVECDTPSKSDCKINVSCRPRLSDFSVSRFKEEFIILEEIGKGDYGCVYKCLNRMNGCVYAIKRSLSPIKTDFQEQMLRNEVYAHGILNHQNIVRNYSCWNEEGYVFIQNEYCNMGNLEDYIKTNVMSETMLHRLLSEMASALSYIHRKGLAHMDIKPANIFLNIDINEDCSFDLNDNDAIDSITFKLGDFGHITRLDEESDIEEGDCRYLPREVIEGHLTHLDKGDIFALGLTIYEASGGGPLPKNGDVWQEIRNGNLNNLEQHSKEFNNILKVMINPLPEKRPSAVELMKMLKLEPSASLPEHVLGYMQQYQHSNTRLEHKVEATGQYLRALYKSHMQLQEQIQNGKEFPGKEKGPFTGKRKGPVAKTRIIGKKTKRSNSTKF